MLFREIKNVEKIMIENLPVGLSSICFIPYSVKNKGLSLVPLKRFTFMLLIGVKPHNYEQTELHKATEGIFSNIFNERQSKYKLTKEVNQYSIINGIEVL